MFKDSSGNIFEVITNGDIKLIKCLNTDSLFYGRLITANILQNIQNNDVYNVKNFV